MQRDITYRDWLTTWVTHLISIAHGPKKEYFFACRTVIKDDLDTAGYLLPHLIVEQLDKDFDKQIYQEIMAVLTVASSSSASEDPEVVMCTQRIFFLLDWLANPQTKDKVSVCYHLSIVIFFFIVIFLLQHFQNIKSSHTTNQNIQKLISEIPRKVLALASFNCQAFERALQHFENYWRILNLNKKGSTNSIDLTKVGQGNNNSNTQSIEDEKKLVVHYLQQIYSKLDEPGLANKDQTR